MEHGACGTFSGVVFVLTQLCDTVADVLGQVRGPAALDEFDPGVRNLTPAYANGDADSDDVQMRLWHVRPSRTPMTIGSLWLLDVTAGPDGKTITWTAPTPTSHAFSEPDRAVKVDEKSHQELRHVSFAKNRGANPEGKEGERRTPELASCVWSHRDEGLAQRSGVHRHPACRAS
jgi:hypothetical protein